MITREVSKNIAYNEYEKYRSVTKTNLKSKISDAFIFLPFYFILLNCTNVD